MHDAQPVSPSFLLGALARARAPTPNPTLCSSRVSRSFGFGGVFFPFVCSFLFRLCVFLCSRSVPPSPFSSERPRSKWIRRREELENPSRIERPLIRPSPGAGPVPQGNAFTGGCTGVLGGSCPPEAAPASSAGGSYMAYDGARLRPSAPATAAARSEMRGNRSIVLSTSPPENRIRVGAVGLCSVSISVLGFSW